MEKIHPGQYISIGVSAGRWPGFAMQCAQKRSMSQEERLGIIVEKSFCMYFFSLLGGTDSRMSLNFILFVSTYLLGLRVLI